MKLNCLRDNCPETGQIVEMSRCCGVHLWSEPCKYYGKKPWAEYMFATCEHHCVWLQNQDRKEHNLMMHDADIDALLCFYDVKKSQKVANCCEVLAELLKVFWDDTWMNNEIKKQ
jgi:hypothetical protein